MKEKGNVFVYLEYFHMYSPCKGSPASGGGGSLPVGAIFLIIIAALVSVQGYRS